MSCLLWAATSISMALILIISWTTPANAFLIYSNDSESLVGPGWSSSTGSLPRSTTPAGHRTFPGEFTNDTLSLQVLTAEVQQRFHFFDPDESWGLDNVRVGIVPEPPTLALLVAAVIVLGVTGRRPRRSSAPSAGAPLPATPSDRPGADRARSPRV